ncbi:MAG: hypothetical protein QOJ35_2986 [Solirubrobacteraceae bacterium]|jgi:hypothetical protein|nr:hypothetical protein [Solirubrobacteraceae bacterium]
MAALAGPTTAAAAARTVFIPERASLVITGAQRTDLAGASVAAAGDVNGDGKADVIVGAPLADPAGRVDAGAAYVVFGGGRRGRLNLRALGARGFPIIGASKRHQHIPIHDDARSLPRRAGAGAVVAGAGDVNGDGLDDLLVSARSPSSAGLAQPRAVVVVFGKRDRAAVDLEALGAGGFPIVTDENLVSLSSGHAAGDVNGDGLADIALTLGVFGSEDNGDAAVVFGKADGAPVDLSGFAVEPTWGLWLVGAHGDTLGSSIANAGDVNGDGLGDVLIGADGAGSRTRCCDGAVFVVYGRRSPGTIIIRSGEPFAGLEIAAPMPGGGFGASVARLGRGFVAGAPGNVLAKPTGPGAVFVIRTPGAPAIRLAGPRRGGPIGYGVSVPGDVDGDGRADVLASGHRPSSRVQSALLFSGTGARIATYTGLRNTITTRADAVGAGDTNADGRPDLLFGSPGANSAYLLTAP